MKVVAAVIIRNELALLTKRKNDSKNSPGKWEFPGGKVEKGESPKDALQRELMEELGVKSDIGEIVTTVKHEDLEITAYHTTIVGDPRAVDCAEVKWVPWQELSNYDLTEADKPISFMIISKAGKFE